MGEDEGDPQPERLEAEISQVWFALHLGILRGAMVWAAGVEDGQAATADEIERWLVNFELECRMHGEEQGHPSTSDMVLDEDEPAPHSVGDEEVA
jgi:hypothetical protein